MVKRIITKRIGEVLLQRGIIDRKKLDQAIAEQKARGGLMGQVLVRMGLVTEEDVALALTAQYGFPYLPLDNYELDGELTILIPEKVAREYCVIPVDRIGNALTLAMSDPTNVKAIEDIELRTKCVVQTFVSTPSDIERAIAKHYKSSASNASAPPASAAGSEGRSGKSSGTTPAP